MTDFVNFKRIEDLISEVLIKEVEKLSRTNINCEIYAIALVFGDLIENHYLTLKVGTNSFLKSKEETLPDELLKYHPGLLMEISKLTQSNELNTLLINYSTKLFEVENENFKNPTNELSDLYARNHRKFIEIIHTAISRASISFSNLDTTDDFKVFFVPYEDICIDDLIRFLER